MELWKFMFGVRVWGRRVARKAGFASVEYRDLLNKIEELFETIKFGNSKVRIP